MEQFNLRRLSVSLVPSPQPSPRGRGSQYNARVATVSGRGPWLCLPCGEPQDTNGRERREPPLNWCRERKSIMTRAPRSSIAGMVALALIAALGLAAMRLASELLAGIMFLVTSGVLCLAFIALICRGPAERAWWLGFNVFGWVYDRFAFRAWGEIRPWLPTTRLLEPLATMAGLTVDPSRPPRNGDPWLPFHMAGQCLFTLLAAVVGGLVAVALFGERWGKSTGKTIERQPEVIALRNWWLGPAIIYSARVSPWPRRLRCSVRARRLKYGPVPRFS